MAITSVKSHTRRGYQVRAHTRRTDGRNIADILARDLDRVYEQDRAPGQIAGADPDCPHPAWYPVLHVDGKIILAYACTDCAATKPAQEARERVLAESTDEDLDFNEYRRPAPDAEKAAAEARERVLAEGRDE